MSVFSLMIVIHSCILIMIQVAIKQMKEEEGEFSWGHFSLHWV